MTTFVIETGPADVAHGIPDWFVDQMPADASPERLMHQYGYHLLGKLREYKADTPRRKHLLLHWSFLQRLAGVHPEIFDEVLAAYAEGWAASM
jgi:hypothetical protein